MYVFAFDRDWTVDVNPHPHHEAVPLEWVRHLAHETDHAVYAIGNQRLVEEASIPGVVDIVDKHPDEWDDWLGERESDSRYERFPERRERLSLIADLHPDAAGYVVVDDLDLSDVAGWDHYHAWEFVPAIERSEIPVTLPDGPTRTDGGLPTTAGLVPGDVADLSSFLHEYRGPGYELTYTESGDTRTRLLWNASVDAVRLERPEDRPAMQCTPLTPGESSFIVDFADIDRLSVVEPPAERYTAGVETPSEEATGLCRLAETKPEAVSVSSLVALLNREFESMFGEKRAVRAVRHVAAVRAEDCLPVVPALISRLTNDNTATPEVLGTLKHIGTAEPKEIAPLTDDIEPYLDATNVTARREATRCFATIADAYPDDVITAVPALTKIIEDKADGWEYAVRALSRLAAEHPGPVKPAVDPLQAVALDESAAETVRMEASAGFGRVAKESPEIAVDIVDDIVALFESEHYRLRNNAAALVYEIAATHTDAVEPYSEDIAALLVADDGRTRINASGALARIAEDFSETIEPLTPMFIRLLGGEETTVRENACWALGYLGATEASASLEQVATDDEDETVRKRANWALTEIK